MTKLTGERNWENAKIRACDYCSFTDLKTLVISEIVDFYAGFESPSESEALGEVQNQLIARIERVFRLVTQAQSVITKPESEGFHNWLKI